MPVQPHEYPVLLCTVDVISHTLLNINARFSRNFTATSKLYRLGATTFVHGGDYQVNAAVYENDYGSSTASMVHVSLGALSRPHTYEAKPHFPLPSWYDQNVTASCQRVAELLYMITILITTLCCFPQKKCSTKTENEL